jgi:hypothetical protein
MREHADLPAMVGFVGKHVAQHFQADRPRPSPSVSTKLRDAARTIAERFPEHLHTASSALGQPRTGLLRRAVRTVELWWNLQVRSGKPDPLAADIVHVREDRRNGADTALRFGTPGSRIKMFDKNLVDAVVGDKNLGGRGLHWGMAELSVSLVLTVGMLTRSHGFLVLDVIIFPGPRLFGKSYTRDTLFVSLFSQFCSPIQNDRHGCECGFQLRVDEESLSVLAHIVGELF